MTHMHPTGAVDLESHRFASKIITYMRLWKGFGTPEFMHRNYIVAWNLEPRTK